MLTSPFKKRILLVEDDKSIVEILEEILESEGYAVEHAYNGQQALDLLRSSFEKPALIFLDLMMPIKDGFGFREEQMLDPDLAGIPVVAMSADGHISEKLQKLGAEHYLKKPIDLDVLLKTLKSVA